MSCLEVRALLPLRPLDALEEDEVGLLTEHLAICSVCATDARAHEAAYARLQETRREDEPREDAAGRVWEKLLVQAAQRTGEAGSNHTQPLALAISLVCSFCHDALARGDACYCASCLAPHHDECFRAHGRCSAYGCEETRTVRPTLDTTGAGTPSEPRAPKRKPSLLRGRRGLPGTILSGAILLGTGGLVTAALTRWSGKSQPSPAQVATTAPDASPSGSPGPESGGLPTPAGVASVTSGDGILHELTVEDVDLRDVMDQIGRYVGANILVEADVREKVTISLRQMPWRDAVATIAKMSRCEVTTLRGGTLMLSQPPRVTIQFTDANVRTVIALLAAYSGKNIVISPEVRGDVTLDLHGVHWLTALTAIAKATGYHVGIHDDVVTIAATPFGIDEVVDESEPLRLSFGPLAVDSRKVDLDVMDADLRDVCDQLARTVGMNMIVEPDVHEKVTAHLHAAPFRDVLVFLSGACKVTFDKRGSLLVASQAPKVTLRATDAPAENWFQLLAAYAGRNLVFMSGSSEEITLDLHSIPWMTAIQLTADAYGYEITEDKDGDVLAIRYVGKAKTAADPVPGASSNARPTEVVFTGGRKLSLALEAIVLGEDEADKPEEQPRRSAVKVPRISWAVISGRRYQAGDPLQDKDGPLTVRVAKIEAGQVTLEAFEDLGSPRVKLKLAAREGK